MAKKLDNIASATASSDEVAGELFSNRIAKESPLKDKAFDTSKAGAIAARPQTRMLPWKMLLIIAAALVLGTLLLLLGLMYISGKNQKQRNLANQFNTTPLDLSSLHSGSLGGNATVLLNGALIVNGPVTAQSFSGNGANLSDVDATKLNHQPGSFYQDASNLDAGTLNDARLSGNVVLLGSSPNFTNLLVTGTTTLQGPATLQDTLAVSGAATFQTTVSVGGDLTVTGDTNINGLTYNWPGTQASGVLSNDGAGNLSWQPVGACASCITDGGNAFGGSISVGTNDANSLYLRTNGTNQVTVNTGGSVGIGTNPGYKLDVNGDVNVSAGNAFRIGGTAICTSGGCAASAGSTDYVQNSASLQTGVNFNFEIASVNSVGGIIRAKAGQVSDLQQWQSSGGVALAYVDAVGDFSANSALKINGTTVCTISGCTAAGGSGSYIQNGTALQTNANFNIQNTNPLSVGGIIRGAVGQSRSLQEWQDSSGGVLAAIDDAGIFVLQNNTGGSAFFAPTELFITDDTFQQYSDITQSGFVTSNIGDSSAINIQPTGIFFYSTTGQASTLQLTASQVLATDLNTRFNVRKTLAVNSTGTLGTVEKFRVNTPATTDNAAATILVPSATTSKGLVVQGVASQTANLQEWQDNTGTVMTAIDSAGKVRFGSTGSVNLYSASSTYLKSDNAIWSAASLGFLASGRAQFGTIAGSLPGMLHVSTNTSATVGAVIRGVTSQTANLQEWQDTSGNILASIGSGGALSLGGASGATGSAIFYNSAGAGGITMQAANPGASSFTVTIPAETGTICTTATSGACTSAGGFVQLQASTPGTAQTGNSNISGIAIAGTAVSVGTNAAAAGAVRLPNNTNISFRNAANSADLAVINVDSSNVINIGSPNQTGLSVGSSGGGTGFTTLQAASGVNFKSGANEYGRFTYSTQLFALGTSLATAGGTVERFRVNAPTTVDNLANVVFGTSATTSKALVIQGLASQTANLTEWQSSTGTVQSFVDASGRIVVGSSMPGIPGAIGINNYTTNTNDLVIQHGDSFGGIVMVNYGTPGGNFGGKLTLGHADGTFASPTQPGSGRIVGSVNFNGWESANTFQNVASIQGAVDATSGTGDWPGRLVFNTTPDGSTTLAERMRIDSSGNVYIGNGATNAAPTSGIVGATGGAGTDIAAANLTLAGGRATGNAAGGKIIFQTSTVGSTGGALQSLATVAQISGTTLEVGSTGTPGTVEKFRVNTPTTVDNSAASILSTGATTSKGLVIQGLASQSANLQEWQSSAGTILNRVASTGAIQLGFNIAIQGEHSTGGSFVDLIKRGSSNDVWVGNTSAEVDIQAINYITFLTSSGQKAQLSANSFAPTSNRGLQLGGASTLWANGYFGSVNASSVGLHVVASASQTANIAQWEDSTGTALSYVTATGDLAINHTGNNLLTINSSNSGSAGIQFGVAGTGPKLISDPVNGALVTLQGGAEKMRLTSGGVLEINSTGTAGTVEKFRVNTPTTTDNSANAIFSTSATTSKGLVVQGVASQTANLTEWQNSGGTVLSAHDASGNLVFGASASSSTGVIRLQNATSIGWRNAGNTGNITMSVNASDILQVTSPAADASTVAQFNNAGATNCTVQPGGTGFACSSDARLKTNIMNLTSTDATDIVSKLQGVSFNWITNPDGQAQVGFIAQDLMKYIPSAVSTDSTGHYVANYTAIIPYLVEAFKKQQTQIDTLSSQTGTSVDVLKELADAKAVTLSGDLIVGGNVVVSGRTETSSENKGSVGIPAGQTSVHVSLPSAFSKKPNINLTPGDFIDGQYRVTNITKTGFTIELQKAQADVVNFDWQAL